MSASATSRLHEFDTPRKGLNIVLWIVQALLGLAFLGASISKLISRPDMVALFAAVGIGQWFRYVTGILELAGAVMILLPKTRSVGAVLLAMIMVGAIVTNVILHASILPPLVLLLLASFVVWGRRRELGALLER